MSKLGAAQVFPQCCQLKGVRCDLAKAHNYGGYGFIYKGRYGNRTICVKAVRLYSMGDNQRNLKVSATLPYFLAWLFKDVNLVGTHEGARSVGTSVA